MKTGIEFFDQHHPRAGDLWVIASGPSMGKSTVLRNIAVGIADHLPEGRVSYWDLEQTHARWKESIQKMRPDVPAALDYRNDSAWQDGYTEGRIVPSLNAGANSSSRVVVIDHFDLYTEDLDLGLKALKVWLVRTGKFGLVSMRLSRSLWWQIKAEYVVDPSTLPETMLDNADTLFVCSRTSQRELDRGVADVLRLTTCKTSSGICEPNEPHEFTWNSETGRLL